MKMRTNYCKARKSLVKDRRTLWTGKLRKYLKDENTSKNFGITGKILWKDVKILRKNRED